MTTAGVIRILLALDIIGMALLALLYLRQRWLSPASFCFWCLIALVLPVFGPFLVIANRPGTRNPDPFPSSRLRQKVRRYCENIKWPSIKVDLNKGSSKRRSPKRWL